MTLSPTAPPYIAVIIPTKDRRVMLRDLLVSLAGQRYPRDCYEVIVVDNHSSDDTDAMVEEVVRATGLRARRLVGEDRGPAPARNLGASSTDAEILAFTDSDCVVSTTWLEAAALAFEDRSVGLVCGPILVPGAPENPFLDLPVTARFLLIDEENPFYPTANVLYRRSVFFEAGCFPAPERHELLGQLQGGDDVELAWIVKRSGWKTAFAPNVLVYHAVHYLTWSQWFRYTLIFSTLPLTLKRVPEIRRLFPLGMLLPYQGAHLFKVGLAGLALAILSPIGLLLWLPFLLFWLRVCRRDLSHPRRWPAVALRIGAWSANHLFLTAILLRSSVVHRSLVL
jgi:glycosyltransferase involved in cell wall biosynthesis